MKSLMPMMSIITSLTPVLLWADGLQDYRLGVYQTADEAFLKGHAEDPIIQYYMGRMRLYGYGTLRHQSMALNYFKKAAQKGHLESALFLGSYSLIIDNNPEQALVFFKKAAEKGDVNAQMYCAAAFQFGYGTKILPDTAKRYIIDAAKNGNPIAQYTLAMDFINSKHSENKKLGLIWLNKAVTAKNIPAMAKMGEFLALGQGVPADETKGVEYLNEAIAAQYGPAFYSMGRIALSKKDFDGAKTWFEKASELDVSESDVALADLYYSVDVPFHNDKEGYLYLLKASQRNNHEAQARLSKLYLEGKFVEKDERLSKEWAKLAKQSVSGLHAKERALSWLTQGQVTSFKVSNYALKGILTPWTNTQDLQQGIYNAAPQKDTVNQSMLFKPHFEKINPDAIALNEYFDLLVKLSGDVNPEDWKFPVYALEKPLVLMKNQGQSSKEQAEQKPFNIYMSDSEMDALNPQSADIKKDILTRAALGDANAAFMAGQMYENGIGVDANIQTAITYYEVASTFQDAKAKYVLGLIYLNGQAGTPDLQKGLALVADAAFKGDAYAQYTMARIYENGYGQDGSQSKIVASKEQSNAFYALAAGANYGKAQFRLAEKLSRETSGDESITDKARRTALIKKLYENALKNGDPRAAIPVAFYDAMDDADKDKQQKAFEVAKAAAEKGDPQASILLGLMYDRGIGTVKNEDEARKWFERNESNPVSLFILGTYDAFKTKDIAQKSSARARLEKSAQAGFSYAYLNLGVLNQEINQPFISELETAFKMGNLNAGMMMADFIVATQEDNPKALAEAREIFKGIAAKGDKMGQLKYGFMLEHGIGGPVLSTEALAQYEASALQEQVQAKFLLAQMYELGFNGQMPDYALAKKWYTSSEGQYAPSAVALGFMYETVDDDMVNAKKAYLKAAEANDINGQYNLALIYEQGKGQVTRFSKARELYIKAAQKGHAKAMTQLAGLYLKGEGVERSVDTAMSWYEKAAALKEPNASYQLGVLAETGLNQDANATKAREYYEEAASQGQQRAMFALARMYQMGIGGAVDMNLAKEKYQQLAKLNNPEAQYQLAMLMLSESQPNLKEISTLLSTASANNSLLATQYLQKEKALAKDSLVSYITSIYQHPQAIHLEKNPNLMYFQAVNFSNRGDIEVFKSLVKQIVHAYPDYLPAKEAYEKLHTYQINTSSLTS